MKHRRRFFDPRYCQERRRAYILACVLFWSILNYLLISRYVVEATEVVGESMQPSLWEGDRLLINRWVYHFGAPRRGDVIAIELPHDEGMAVKRVIALPNERVQIRFGRVYVNGRPLDEPYLDAKVITGPGLLSSAQYVVEASTYFVLGDNRPHSTDSRFFGTVPRDMIQGRITSLLQPVR